MLNRCINSHQVCCWNVTFSKRILLYGTPTCMHRNIFYIADHITLLMQFLQNKNPNNNNKKELNNSSFTLCSLKHSFYVDRMAGTRKNIALFYKFVPCSYVCSLLHGLQQVFYTHFVLSTQK